MTLRQHVWAMLLGIILFASGQAVWHSAADVVWFEKSEPVLQTPHMVQLRIKGYKVRDCKYIKDSEVGYVLARGGDWIESDFAYVDDPSPGNSKPSSFFSRLSFGVWEWTQIDVPPLAITHVQATVAHDCGGDDLRTTTVGPFKLSHIT